MGGHCFYCGDETGPEEIEENGRFYCSRECLKNERLDFELERGLEAQERRERNAELEPYYDDIF